VISKIQTSESRLSGRCLLTLALFTGVESGPGWAQALPHSSGRLLVKSRGIVRHPSDQGWSFWLETPRNLPGGSV
jgi:hypothetical protein